MTGPRPLLQVRSYSSELSPRQLLVDWSFRCRSRPAGTHRVPAPVEPYGVYSAVSTPPLPSISPLEQPEPQGALRRFILMSKVFTPALTPLLRRIVRQQLSAPYPSSL
jgi:hypothetical protein